MTGSFIYQSTKYKSFTTMYLIFFKQIFFAKKLFLFTQKSDSKEFSQLMLLLSILNK